MVFVFQKYGDAPRMQETKQPFEAKQTYSLDFSKIFGTDDVPNVRREAVRYIEVYLKTKGIETTALSVKVSGADLNSMCNQATISNIISDHNKSAPNRIETLPSLTSKEVQAAITVLLPDAKYENIKDTIPTPIRK
ncbi:MAG: hypothetical protein WC717_00020 [Candidatus Micrarchaeia archaeon]|jgi:hypothetical protein